uniref:hybrid sensor histidine kinase/response regulator n=1 Tax=Agathobacter sp. TaxID=2021311 RepID=UPI004056E639
MDIMLIGMAYIGIDILWGIIYADFIPIPICLQKIIYALFYAASGVLTYRWFVFVEYMQDSIFYKDPVLRQLRKIPMLIVVVISFLSIWTGSFFHIGENGEYIRGPLYVLQLCLTYGYIIFSAIKVLFLMFVTREFEKQNTYMIIVSYFTFPIIFGILQIANQDMPYLCIGITLASFQHYLFSVKFEQERAISASKIHSLTRLFTTSYYLDLQTEKWQYLSIRQKQTEPYFTGSFHVEEPENFKLAINMNADIFVHTDDRETYCTMCSRDYMLEHLNEENRFYSFNYRQVVGGTEKWYRMHVIAASYAPDGKVTHAVLAVMDVDKQITTDLQQQQALEEALVRAENANKAKSTFLSNMSHDIRTPMNAIVGFTNLAQTHIKDPVLVNEYLGKILSASNHLLNLINDILNMSRIESGKIKIEESEMTLTEIIHDIDSLIQPMTLEKNLHFAIHTDITDNYIYCDKLRLNQILINLLGNAVKFTPQGGEIALCVEQAANGVPDGYGTYIFRVKDNGIGIGAEFLAKIFQPFEREAHTDASGIQGTGLGLSITKSLIEMMGGAISVESELGKGTEFIVKVAFKIQDEKEQALSAAKKEKEQALQTLKNQLEDETFIGRKLLLVDDNEINREIANVILTDAGFIVAEAIDGREAVETIQNAVEDEFAAVLMDVQMPVMNGYQATKAIRKLPNPALANIPIIAMTANAFDEDKKEAFESGMDGHIAKPIDIAVLFATLKQIIQ